MPPESSELLQGTLEMLVLKALSLAPLHGWGIGHRIDQLSKDAFQVQQGSLYPALYRLEDKGLIAAEWGISPEGRKAKFYHLTPSGRKQLARETEAWKTWSGAVNLVLRTT
jgi:PadR family transcriptional regulator PadR